MSLNTNSTNYYLAIDYEYCTGCHSCEVACKKRLELKKGEYGIKLFEYGPVEVVEDKWDWNYVPFPTALCDMCLDRIEAGKLPTCVHNCQAKIIQFGTYDELKPVMEFKKNQVMYTAKKNY